MSHCTLHNYQEEVVEEVEVELQVVLLGDLGVVPEFVWIDVVGCPLHYRHH